MDSRRHFPSLLVPGQRIVSMDSEIQTAHLYKKPEARQDMKCQESVVSWRNTGEALLAAVCYLAAYPLDCHSPRQETWGASLLWRSAISVTRGPFSSGERSG